MRAIPVEGSGGSDYLKLVDILPLEEAGYDPDGATVRNEKIVCRGLPAVMPKPGHRALRRSLD